MVSASPTRIPHPRIRPHPSHPRIRLRKLDRPFRTATLRHPTILEAVHITHPRWLNRQQVLVERACRRNFTARYIRMASLLHELAVRRGDDSPTRLLARLTKFDLPAIDDWMLAPIRDAATSPTTGPGAPTPPSVNGDPNQPDAICERLLDDAA